MCKKYRILIVEDHALLRQGLCALLSKCTDMEVVVYSENVEESFDLIAHHKPHLVLIDLSMLNDRGAPVVSAIKNQFPSVKIIALTTLNSQSYIKEILRAGVDGFVIKYAAEENELILAIRSVLNGKAYLSPEITESVINGYLEGFERPQKTQIGENLTSREREVLVLIAQGFKSKHIANNLNISVKTIEKHRSNLMKKLGLHNVAMLTTYAINQGLVNSAT